MGIFHVEHKYSQLYYEYTNFSYYPYEIYYILVTIIFL